MSEMTAKEYLEIKNRMCAIHEPNCCECPLIESGSAYCDVTDNLDKAIAIVQKWGEEHPVVTLMDKFFEVFPGAKKNKDGTPTIRPEALGYDGSCYRCQAECLKCWSQHYTEAKGGAE